MGYELRRNIAVNPNASSLVHWGQMGSGGQTLSLDNAVFHNGNSSVKTTCTVAGQTGLAVDVENLNFNTGDSISWSLWGYYNVAGGFSLYWERTSGAYTGGNGVGSNSSITVAPNTWGQVSGSYQFTAGQASPTDTYHFGALVNGNSAVNNAFNVDEIIVEKASTVGPYFDGDTPATPYKTHRWLGAANNSASVEESILSQQADLYSLADIEYAYWKATSGLSSGSLADVMMKGLQVKTGKSGLSLSDLEMTYWKSLSGLANGSVQDHKSKVIGNDYRSYYAGFFK